MLAPSKTFSRRPRPRGRSCQPDLQPRSRRGIAGNDHDLGVAKPRCSAAATTDRADGPPWPRVPRSPALRLRYDCRSRLDPKDFLRVEELLSTVVAHTDSWLSRHPALSRDRVQNACDVLAFAMPPIRRTSVRQPLRSRSQQPGSGRKTAPGRLKLAGRAPTAEEANQLLDYTDPRESGRDLAAIITGLPDDPISVIGVDQVTTSLILGEVVLEHLQRILLAAQQRGGARFPLPSGRSGVQAMKAALSDHADLHNDELTAILAWPTG
jgi:hypothetical protein